MAFVACGSGGGVGDDDAQVDEDSGESPDVTMGPDAGNQKDASPQDSTTTFESGPSNDATLDVEFGDAIWTADSQGGGNDAANDTGTGCSPDEILCNGNVAEICKNGNLSTQTCTNGQVCADGYGCVTCVPGSGTCNGSTASLCNSLGTGYTTSTCDSQLGLSCQAGVCVGDCSNIGQSYIGCEYYAATMLNDQLDQTTFPFAISVANTTSKAATVTVSGPQTVTGSPFTISANSIQSIVLPWESSVSATTGTLKQTGGAYHVKSTEPVTVYQFNARDYQVGTSFSYTNDASLLIPVNALTGNYYVVSFPDWNASADGYASQHLPGLITIVGTTNSTSVQFTPGVSVAAGAGITATGTSTVTLNAGDVLQINSTANATASAYGTDPSGSVIKASQPVEVFGGSDCTNVPVTIQACDHLEEVVFPLETLATTYAVVPPNMTGITTTKKPSHFLRMVGTVNNTSLTYTPSVTGAPATLSAGQVSLFETSTPFQV
ncbi:MAG TPA: IgGFc-binding protein, partial [Polyangiaceae bacterium]